MTLEDLRNDLGSKINQVDESTGAFVAAFVTSTEADRWLNQSYEDVYKWYAIANQKRMCDVATADTVASQATYSLGGDATDVLAIAWVGIKYAVADTKFTRAYSRDYNDLYLTGGEEVPASAPVYLEKQIYNTVTTHYEAAIEFPDDCTPTVAVTDGLQIRYVARPPLMTADGSMPEKLPTELHKLIVRGAAVPALEKMGEYSAAEFNDTKFRAGLREFFVQEQSLTSDTTKRIKMRRKDALRFYKRMS